MITNNLGLPDAIVRAVTNDPYSKGNSDYSVTGLLKPARVVALEAEHAAEIVEDAADRIWALCGQIGHLILERAGGADLVEKRLFATRPHPFNSSATVRVSGQLDWEHHKRILDYKFTSAWTCKNGPKEEWVQQTNLGRWLCHENGIAVESIQIVAILRDWSLLEAQRDASYPQQQVKVFDIELWPLEKTIAFLDGRIAEHERAKESLPECSPQERWAKPDAWAVIKKGRTRAVKLHYDEPSAVLHAKREKGLSVKHRPGQNVRCQAYCRVAPFCEQWKQLRGTP